MEEGIIDLVINMDNPEIIKKYLPIHYSEDRALFNEMLIEARIDEQRKKLNQDRLSRADEREKLLEKVSSKQWGIEGYDLCLSCNEIIHNEQRDKHPLHIWLKSQIKQSTAKEIKEGLEELPFTFSLDSGRRTIVFKLKSLLEWQAFWQNYLSPDAKGSSPHREGRHETPPTQE